MMEMDEKGVEQIKKLIIDFRSLATKVQEGNKEKSKNLKDTNQVLEACKKEYQKLYHENEALKKELSTYRKDSANINQKITTK